VVEPSTVFLPGSAMSSGACVVGVSDVDLKLSVVELSTVSLPVSAMSSGVCVEEVSDVVGMVECGVVGGLVFLSRSGCGSVVEEVVVQLWEGKVKAEALTALARHATPRSEVSHPGLRPASERCRLGVKSSSFTDVVEIQGNVTYRSSQCLWFTCFRSESLNGASLLYSNSRGFAHVKGIAGTEASSKDKEEI
jgi:hypothetical protein